MSKALLQVRNLTTKFGDGPGAVTAVNNVSFEVNAGETVAIVGESGSGKSVTALSILRLIPEPPGRITAGEIVFDGIELTKLKEEEMRAIRGNRIAMIFQEPMTSLNPSLTIGLQISEPINLHKRLSWHEGLRQGEGAARPRADARRAQPARYAPAPVLGRHAPAHHDRDGARLPAEADHCR